MTKYSLIFLTFFITACYEFKPLSIIKDNKDIIFSLTEDTLSELKTKHYIFQNFGVEKDNCETDCIVWEIALSQDIQLKNINPGESAIHYGITPDNFNNRHKAQILTAGKYTAGGTISYIDTENQLKGKSFFLKFEIIKDKNNELIIR